MSDARHGTTMKSRIAITISLAGLYAAACWLPFYYAEGGFAEEGMEFYGLHALLIGWMGQTIVIWAANPLLLIGVILYLIKQDGAATIFAAAASVAALGWLAVMVPSDIRFSPPFAIVISEQAEIRIGYPLWVATSLILFVAALTSLYLGRGPTKEPYAPSSDPTAASPLATAIRKLPDGSVRE